MDMPTPSPIPSNYGSTPAPAVRDHERPSVEESSASIHVSFNLFENGGKGDEVEQEAGESRTTCLQIPSPGGGPSDENTCWDIGIPPEYNSLEATMKGHHLLVINGFMASLAKLLQYENEGPQFDQVLSSIKIYTQCLVSAGAPLVDWNSLAQQVLRASKDMGDFLSSMDQVASEDVGPLMLVRDSIDQWTSTIEQDGTMRENIRKKLALAQLERSNLMPKLAVLDNQIREAEEEVTAIDQRMTHHLELRRRSSAVLNQYEAVLSTLSSTTCQK